MTRHRVPVYGTIDKRIEVENGATKGATVGVNLYNQDGTLVGIGDIALSTTVIRQIINQIGGDTVVGGGGPSTTTELPEGTNLYYTDARAYDAAWFMWDHTYHIGANVTRVGDQIFLEVLEQNVLIKYQPGHGISRCMAIHLTGTNWEKADADDDTKTADAICWDVRATDTLHCAFAGPVYATLAEWDAVTGDTGGLVPGDYYWLDTTPGKITKTQPAGLQQCLGVAISPTILLVRIGEVLVGGGAGGGGGGSTAGLIGCTFDGGGAVLAAGATADVYVPFNCTVTAATILADQAGSLVVSVWADTYANYPPDSADNIAASAPPTVTAATKSRDTVLTGWTTAITAGKTVRFRITSCATIKRATVQLEVTKA